MTLVQGHSDSKFSNFFSLETAGPIEAKFHAEPPLDKGMKVNTNTLCHMAKMAAMPIYDKNLLWNQKADDLETWYAAFVSRVLPNIFNDALVCFYGRSNLIPFVFIGKYLHETIEASEVKCGTYSQINEYMTIYDNPRSRSFTDLCPRSFSNFFS